MTPYWVIVASAKSPSTVAGVAACMAWSCCEPCQASVSAAWQPAQASAPTKPGADSSVANAAPPMLRSRLIANKHLINAAQAIRMHRSAKTGSNADLEPDDRAVDGHTHSNALLVRGPTRSADAPLEIETILTAGSPFVAQWPAPMIGQLPPLPSVIACITWSMPKLAAFIRGGNWAKLCSHFET